MLALWRALHSYLADTPRRNVAPQRNPENGRQAGRFTKDFGRSATHRTPIVALVVNHHDRKVLTGISGREPLEMHFAESREEAWDAVHRLSAPVILYDRDWPNAEWRSTVQAFASLPQRSCVILASRVADDYLWQELIRCGGHDLLAKPFRAEDAARSLKLASSFWTNARGKARYSVR